MAKLLDFYFLQLVQESDMDTLQLNLEDSQRQLFTDQQYSGIASGYDVVQHSPTPDLTVDIAGPGVAYDDNGRRVFLPAPVNLDVSLDSQGAPTLVNNGGNEKWISVFTQFERDPSDLRFDGNGFPVNFRQDEGQKFIVVQGAEALAGTATRPTIIPDAKLIGDILIEFGTTQIDNGLSDVSVPRIESADVVAKPLSRFPFMFNLTASSPAQIRVGPLPAAMQAILTELNNHINGITGNHDATAIDTSNTALGWQFLPPALNVQTSLDAIPLDLIDQQAAGGFMGSNKIGHNFLASDWHDGLFPGGGAAGALGSALNVVVRDLAEASFPDCGTSRIGGFVLDHTATGVEVSTFQALFDQLQDIVDKYAHVEQLDEEFAVIKQTTFPANDVYRLIYESGTEVSAGFGAIRVYVITENTDGNPTGGFCVTQNARWLVGAEQWTPDRTTEPARRWGFGRENGTAGFVEFGDTGGGTWSDNAWYREGVGTFMISRGDGQAEIDSGPVSLDCTSQFTAPVDADREYQVRYGTMLEATATNQDYGSCANFPGTFQGTPTTIGFNVGPENNVTGVETVENAAPRGLVISHTASTSEPSFFSGDVTVTP